MCLELASPDQPIQIPFAEEVIWFEGPQSYYGQHTFLVKNAGYEDIGELVLLYPRPLLTVEDDPATGRPVPRLDAAQVLAAGFPDNVRFMAVPGSPNVAITLADPNNPVCDLPTFEGYWDPSNFADASFPLSMYPYLDYVADQFEAYSFTAWIVKLRVPIRPGQAHWLRWGIRVGGVGEWVPSGFLGPAVFHEVVSPIDVRRMVVESVENGLRQVTTSLDPAPDDAPVEAALRAILTEFRLLQERRVDIQYYELTILPGNPRHQVLVNPIQHGDIRMRSGSPRLVTDDELPPAPRPPLLEPEPIYEWKSGSMLEPAHPWRNGGFSIRFTLFCDPVFGGGVG